MRCKIIRRQTLLYIHAHTHTHTIKRCHLSRRRYVRVCESETAIIGIYVTPKQVQTSEGYMHKMHLTTYVFIVCIYAIFVDLLENFVLYSRWFVYM